jgi:tetratricopeptide (TPR) repeat protein
MPGWLYGSALYGYGYSPYSNPYYGSYAGAGGAAVPYDYSQPINTASAASADAVTEEALALFGSARDAFKQGNYEVALQQANDALTKIPSDTALHEFRGLCLFALGRYDEAATTLYAVLAAGPGWDWPTLIGLYPNVEVYTTQLRALEASCKANPQLATGRLVLAYHYLTEGYLEDAAKVLKQVVALKPSDTIAAKLLEQIEAARQSQPGAEAMPPPAPAPVPANTTPPEGATISGTWNAQPGPDASIVLTIQPGGAYTWQVTQKGQTQQFAGVSTFGGGVLTLAQDNGTVLVGRVNWKDPAHMTFRVIGNSPDDPGLSFAK